MTVHHLVDLTNPEFDEAATTPLPASGVVAAILPTTVEAHEVAVGDVIFGIGCAVPVGRIATDGIWWKYATDDGIVICQRRGDSRLQVVRQ